MRSKIPPIAAILFLALAAAGCGQASQAANASPPPPPPPRAQAGAPAKPVPRRRNTTLWGGNPLPGRRAAAPTLPSGSATSAVDVVPLSLSWTVKPPAAPPPPRTVEMPVPADAAGGFSAYLARVGRALYILAPKGLHGGGTVATDGSFSITLRGPQGALHIVSAGACVGCSVDAAAPFFASARKAAADYGGFHGQTMRELGATLTHPGARTALYAYPVKGGLRADGFAFYSPRGHSRIGQLFLTEVFIAPPSSQPLAPWILRAGLDQVD